MHIGVQLGGGGSPPEPLRGGSSPPPEDLDSIFLPPLANFSCTSLCMHVFVQTLKHTHRNTSTHRDTDLHTHTHTETYK